jgi:hypothetical protein
MHFSLDGYILSSDDQDILGNEVKNYQTAQSSPLNSSDFFFHLHSYCLWFEQGVVNGYPGLTPLTDRVFLKRESSTIYWHQCRF